jgi:poly(3-hydroxyoctanoate) depolymerase
MKGTAYVRAGGLRVRIARSGSGRPLLLITGIGANLDMWAPFARLVDDRELIAFDPPGAGLSERPRAPLRMKQLAGIVRELMDVLAVERADVLGYSFGGALAQELARRAPDRVRRLVLCATAAGVGGVPPRPLAALMLATPARYYHPRLLALSMRYIAGGRSARDPSALAAHAGARLARPPDVLGYAYQLYAAAGWSSLPWLHRVSQPTLIVAGDRDPSVPALNARILASRLPDARIHIIEGGGHLFLLDEPESAVGRIRAFLDDPL